MPLSPREQKILRSPISSQMRSLLRSLTVCDQGFCHILAYGPEGMSAISEGASAATPCIAQQDGVSYAWVSALGVVSCPALCSWSHHSIV